MAEQDQNQQDQNQHDSGIVAAAKTLGSLAGKVAHAVGVAGENEAPAAAPPPAKAPPARAKAAPAPPAAKAALPEGTWESQNLGTGSGTFLIKKPSRNKNKLHQTRAKSPQRGARK